MDFLNKFYEQLSDLFASMTPGARLTTGALLAVVVLSFGFLFKQSTSGPGEMLYGGEPLTRQEIIDIQGALSQAQLSDFEVVGNMIRVPSGKKHLYLAAIADANAAPRNAKSFLDEALNNASPFAPSNVREQQIKAAREKELSHTISQMPWVEIATVLYDEKLQRGPRPVTLASATVNIMPKRGEGVDTRRRRALQELVSSSFASMKSDQVAVINLNGDDLMTDGAVSPDDFETPYLKAKARFEQAVRRDVLTHLSYIPGVRVQIKAELDEKLSQETITTRPEGTPVTLREEETTETSDSQNTDGGAQPGVVAQGPGRGRSEAASERKNTAKTSRNEIKTDLTVGHTQDIIKKSGLVPKEMGASIEVPMDYIVGLWRKQKLASEGQEPDLVNYEEVKLVEGNVVDQIKTAIEPLMTELAAGQDDYQQVKVVTYDTLPVAPIEPPSAVDNAMFWAGQHGSSLGMLGLAAFSLVMLRSMVRSASGVASSRKPDLELNTPEPTASAAEDEEDDDRPRLKLKKPDSVTDDLADMVREDPDAAAAILSNWISNATSNF